MIEVAGWAVVILAGGLWLLVVGCNLCILAMELARKRAPSYIPAVGAVAFIVIVEALLTLPAGLPPWLLLVAAALTFLSELAGLVPRA